MTKKFLDKYQDYCKDKERREEVFKMMQHEDESLEDYVEWFTYNLQREKQGDLAPETWCVLFLRGIWDDCIELLNLMGGGDVSQLEYDIILELFISIPEAHKKWEKGQEIYWQEWEKLLEVESREHKLGTC
jgi:hypothetical protein